MKKYIESFVNYRFLLWELVKKGIKLKYRRSYLGIIWSLLEPLLTMIVSVSYTHLTLPTKAERCRSRWSPYH